MPRKPDRRGGNVVPMKGRRRRRPTRRRPFRRRAETLILLAALAVALAFNFDDLAADLGSLIGLEDLYGNSGAGADLAGRVTHVRDGDTVEVSGVPVRIANLDCAESGTAAGEQATERMRQLARTGPFSCDLEGRMSYDRQVGTCQLADGRDVGEVLIGERQCGRWY